MNNDPVFYIFGEPVEILVTSKATNYSFCTGVQTSPPGGGPPPHKHEREEEIFMVIEGDFEFFDGREWSRFMKDEVKYSMRGNFHGFRNCGKTTGRLPALSTRTNELYPLFDNSSCELLEKRYFLAITTVQTIDYD